MSELPIERVKAFMTRGVIAIDPAESVQSAARKMSDLGIGCMITPDGENMITIKGIVHDVVSKGMNPASVRVADVMEPAVHISLEKSIRDAFVLLATEGVDYLVVMRGDTIEGIFSVRDFLNIEVMRLEGAV